VLAQEGEGLTGADGILGRKEGGDERGRIGGFDGAGLRGGEEDGFALAQRGRS
jgi:hypothetical protein